MRAIGSGVFALLMVSSAAASAEEPRWEPQWPKFRPAEIAFTLGSGLQSAMGVFLYAPPRRNFEGGVLFDDAARDALRLRTRGGRTAAATVSDMMYYSLLAYPLLDAPIVGGVRGGSEIAVQTLAMNLESYAVAGAYALAAEKLGRARPLAAECERDPSYDPRCDDEARNNASNLSGHTALSFTGAGLTCAHHLHMPLYARSRGGAPDIGACAATMTVAGVGGVLRVMSDNHYATDVLLGSMLGFASGYLLPRFLHYRHGSGADGGASGRSLLPTYTSRESGLVFVVAPRFDPTSAGLSIIGAL